MVRHRALAPAAVILVFSFISRIATGEEQTSLPDPADLLEQAVSAIAPPDEFDKMTSLQFRGKSKSPSHDPDQSTSPANTDMLMVFPGHTPDRLLMHSIFKPASGITYVRTLAGDRSYAEQVGRLPEDLHRDFVRYASTKLLTILRFRKSPHLTAKVVGSERIDGGNIDLVQITLFDFQSVLEIERDSGRVHAVRFNSSEIQEGVVNKVVRREYSDLRSVHGFLIPFLQTVTVDDELYSEWQLDEVFVNGEYDASVFDLAD